MKYQYLVTRSLCVEGIVTCKSYELNKQTDIKCRKKDREKKIKRKKEELTLSFIFETSVYLLFFIALELSIYRFVEGTVANRTILPFVLKCTAGKVECQKQFSKPFMEYQCSAG